MKYCSICKKTASYGYIDEQTPKYCSNCSKDVKDGILVNFKHGYCEEVINYDKELLSERLCAKNANFNYPNSSPKKGVRCNQHKLEGMLCINGKICIDCGILQASFVLPKSDKKSPTHCGDCLKKYDVEKIDVSHKKCIICKIKSATFGKDKKEYCSSCVKDNKIDAMDLHHKRCISCKSKEAIFNVKDEKPLYCGDCKMEGMINIYGLKCEGCNKTTPSYNYSGMKDKRFCKDCSLEGMINVKDKLCEKCNNKRPSFNYSGESVPLYCNDCKTESMINVFYNICEAKDCKEIAWYNYEDESCSKYCKSHSMEGMINLKISLCIVEGCNLTASFNYIKETKELYCLTHKLDGMVNIHHPKCKECSNRASFNHYGEKTPIYCSLHKEDLMVNVCQQLCKTHLCGKQVSNKYEGYCMVGFIHLFPDKSISKNYCTKEKAVRNFILSTFTDVTWYIDQKIIDGCSKRRPDLLVDLGDYIIIIEIDENQHIKYDTTCEYKRLVDISDDLRNRPIVLIRFNPDDYILKDGTKKLSCWNINNKGLYTVKKSYEKEWKDRLTKLKEKISFWLNPENIIKEELEKILIEIEYLFFDEI